LLLTLRTGAEVISASVVRGSNTMLRQNGKGLIIGNLSSVIIFIYQRLLFFLILLEQETFYVQFIFDNCALERNYSQRKRK
jgi:TM2 domain-containing membrane protein YozV